MYTLENYPSNRSFKLKVIVLPKICVASGVLYYLGDRYITMHDMSRTLTVLYRK